MELKIINICTDGYERFVDAETEDKKRIIVHFLEYKEYIDYKKKSELKFVGDIIKGALRIDLVTVSYIENGELMFEQPYKHSSHIIATVEVKKIVDEFSLYAKTNICDEDILLEFENKVKYAINDRIYVVGSLEFDIMVGTND